MAELIDEGLLPENTNFSEWGWQTLRDKYVTLLNLYLPLKPKKEKQTSETYERGVNWGH
jgi:hypothetical protein